jgi:molecular chaperone DnaK (HSP70)
VTVTYAVGIDLGTTHTAMASVRLDPLSAKIEITSIAQLVARGTVERRQLLPSFLYFAHESEGHLALPWDSQRAFAVGEYARARSTEAPARVVSSAKSWLCHPAIDRREGVLPLGAPEDVEKISPVEASWHYLDHLSESWAAEAEGDFRGPLSGQEIVLTVPASFDAAARDLTVEAAYAAGLERLTLLEEPQAALYAWIEAAGEAWRQHLAVGDVILVVDVGGGTTDLSAIAVDDEEGSLGLRRIAVGDHILLGGDNMDLALAHLMRKKLEAEGKELDRWQMASLVHMCRGAKEILLGVGAPASVPIAVAGRGSQLLGNTLRTELTLADVEHTLVDGFFPVVAATAKPATRARTALTQLGLPYAADPGVTRHLAAFLTRQAEALGARSSHLLRPTKVLFNGGVFKAIALRERLLDTLNGWLEQDGAKPARVLPGEDPDLAVARGAAYFGLVRRGQRLRIRGGTARAYYVGVESPTPAVPGVEPPLTALCVAPFGMEEGTEAALPPQQLGVVVGEPVRFRFFDSSVRRGDPAGHELEHWEELEELAPIEITLPAEGRPEGDVVPVRLTASVTPVGTLLLEALPIQPLSKDERWKVEFSVRAPTRGAESTEMSIGASSETPVESTEGQ